MARGLHRAGEAHVIDDVGGLGGVPAGRDVGGPGDHDERAEGDRRLREARSFDERGREEPEHRVVDHRHEDAFGHRARVRAQQHRHETEVALPQLARGA